MPCTSTSSTSARSCPSTAVLLWSADVSYGVHVAERPVHVTVILTLSIPSPVHISINTTLVQPISAESRVLGGYHTCTSNCVPWGRG